jgi:hypothetical protein
MNMIEIERALRELRYGFRIFKDYRGRRKVTIFGSARTAKTDPDYKQALHGRIKTLVFLFALILKDKLNCLSESNKAPTNSVSYTFWKYGIVTLSIT